MSRTERLVPNYRKLELALRSIGYSFEVAVADIIDNSIDAQARRILVRLITKQDGHLDLAIWDDGHGMNEATLKEAMRFGTDISDDMGRLGKFGLGLKLASLSQAKELRVISSKQGKLCGRAWLENGIAQGFQSTPFDASASRKLADAVLVDRKLGRSGTLVWWSNLYRVGHNHGDPAAHAQKLLHRLESYLALAFHRFLSGRRPRVEVSLDIFDKSSSRSGVPVQLDPLDPFDYAQSGREGFPAVLSVDGEYGNQISIRAHIWPANSSSPSYKLPGGANSRQGFYFYRNDRLIQGGGWNGIRETEPHASLARLEVDIGPTFDVDLSLDVKKVEIQLPPALATAIQKAKSPSGVDFKKYVSVAVEAYRKRAATESELPLIPSAGLPAPLTEYLHKELRLKGTAKHKDLKIEWSRLDSTSFFEIDPDNGQLHLNQLYRKQLLHGLSGSSADLPVLKCLLFLLLEGALSSERLGSKIRERLEQVDRILVKAVKYERGLNE